MNTKFTTQDLFNSSLLSLSFEDRGEHNFRIKQLWKEYLKTNRPTASQMLARNIMLGHPAARGFTPVSSSIKLANGHQPWAGFEGARSHALWSPQHAFAPWLDLDPSLNPREFWSSIAQSEDWKKRFSREGA